MGMTVRKSKDTSTVRVVMHRVADIRGGVSIVTAELTQDYIKEGTPLSAPGSNGMSHVVKFAKVAADATNSDTRIKVHKGHNFKVGDIVCAVENGKAYAITEIDSTDSETDIITVGTTLAVALTANTSYLFQAKTAGASGSKLKYEPFAIVGTGRLVEANSNIDTDAWVIAVTKGNALPDLIANKLKGIINYD